MRFKKYFIILSLLFLSPGSKAEESSSQEMLAQLIVSMAREGKTIKGVLDLLKRNIPRSEYENTLKLLKSRCNARTLQKLSTPKKAPLPSQDDFEDVMA